MKTITYPSKNNWTEILKRPAIDSVELMESVKDILSDVKIHGDEALFRLTKEYDGADIKELRVSDNEFRLAESQVEDELKEAISLARDNIERFHSIQREPKVSCETSPGVRVWQKSLPIEKVGLYIPGGTAPLLSTILMLGIPAKLAGCSEIINCTPPNSEGEINPGILFVANLLDIKNVFKVGGAQAIAAMAYGTETIPSVYKIFGPGNQYVTTAKLQVSMENVAIDMPAGPSELAIIADDSSNPAFIASDLLSQAEHGTDSQVILVTNSSKLVEKVKLELQNQLEELPRKNIALKSLENSKFLVMKSEDEMIEIINEYGPEHLIIVTQNYKEVVDSIKNAGSIFLGEYTPESAGDYASGTNHTLPTNGMSKAYSGVNLSSFMKKITYQEISAHGIQNIGSAIERMAEAEELTAHKNAVSIRLNSLNNEKK